MKSLDSQEYAAEYPRLTAEEKDVLIKVTEELQGRYDGKVEVQAWNEDYVDFIIEYPDGEEETVALERDQLISGKTIEEIVYWVA